VQNLSYENEADLHENEPGGGTHLNLTRFDIEARSNSDMVHLMRTTTSLCLYNVVAQDVSNL